MVDAMDKRESGKPLDVGGEGSCVQSTPHCQNLSNNDTAITGKFCFLFWTFNVATNRPEVDW